jgi:hypothetical protein
MGNEIKLGNLSISSFKVGSADTKVYLGDTLLYPTTPSFQGKWLATYSDSHTESAACDASSAITEGEITLTNLVSVQLGNCVTSIGNDAFMFYDSLTSITIPNSVTTIGYDAFRDCTSLTSIDIPSGVTSIGEFAFNDCFNLQSITIEATTPPRLGPGVFDYTNNCPIYVPCESVAAYKAASEWSTYANRITCIEPPLTTGKYRASYSDGNSLELSCNTNTLISDETQPSGYEISALTSATIGSCVTQIGISAFENATNLERLTLSEGLEIIDFKSFKNCSSLKSVTFPESLTSIGTDSFSGCSGLLSITFLSDTPIRLYGNTFADTNNCPIYVPSASLSAYQSATGWSSYINRIQAIPNS